MYYQTSAEQLAEIASALGYPTALLGGIVLVCSMGGAVRLSTDLADLEWADGTLYVASATQEVRAYLDRLLR